MTATTQASLLDPKTARLETNTTNAKQALRMIHAISALQVGLSEALLLCYIVDRRGLTSAQIAALTGRSVNQTSAIISILRRKGLVENLPYTKGDKFIQYVASAKTKSVIRLSGSVLDAD